MKVLLINPSGAGVYYYRTFLPYKNLKNEIDVDIMDRMVEDENVLFEYDIIHFHTTIVDFKKMPILVSKLKTKNIKLIMDLDDFWEIPRTHHKYSYFKKMGLSESIKQNMKLADAITVTNNYLGNKARKYNSNVFVVENGIDFTEPQFMMREPKQKVKTTYGMITGSSHKNDVELLRGVSNKIYSKYKDNVATIICGYDLRGEEYGFNYAKGQFLEDLKRHNIYNKDMLDKIESKGGLLNKIKGFPKSLVMKYNGRVVGEPYKRPITPQKSVWYFYERILTNDFKNIVKPDYLNYLHTFQDRRYMDKNVNHIRIHTKPVEEFADSYNEMDISLAPLTNNPFNACKSNLKQLEAGAFKKPIICSEVYPYMIDGVNGENCFIVPEKKSKLWFKYLDKLLKSEQLRIDMGEKLHEVVKSKYDINILNDKRLDLYKKLLK